MASDRILMIIRISLGLISLVFGIIGLILPVVPQTIFFILAFVLLFPSHPRVTKIMTKFEPRFPRLVGWLRRLGVGKEAVVLSHDLHAPVRPSAEFRHDTDTDERPPHL